MTAKLSQTDAAALAEKFEKEGAETILKWTFENYGKRAALACSLGAEDMVLTHMFLKVNPQVRIFCLDTGRLNPETYDVLEKVREKYGYTIEVMFPATAEVETMVKEHGMNLFYRSIEMRKLCCKVRKVNPLRRVLSTVDCWITGLRREQAVTRLSLGKAEIDDGNGGILKLNPLADWTEKMVWDYIRANDVPYNALHDGNYPSIGCAPCTRAIKEGEDVRAGRWWWEAPEYKECGLHIKSS
ncbi:MAG: phosphoadenylyl-sulfate reductase [Deltaproteobacteria bacterium]|nr:phosphoadenylyl-sulfate reductase [Deltaproteobacteria bacterium]